jgi:RNA polymerase sigma-70 factor (ECF subfamily)
VEIAESPYNFTLYAGLAKKFVRRTNNVTGERISLGRRHEADDGRSDLLSAADEGKIDPAIVADLFEAHAEELRRFLIGVLRDGPLADDAVQAAFAKMVERGHETKEETRKAWLFRVAYNEVLVVRRRQATGRNVLERVAWSVEQQQAGPEDPLVREESIERVKSAIEALPFEQGRIVRMRIYEEKTFAVIAQELKIPLGTALGRMRTALLKLKKLLEE